MNDLHVSPNLPRATRISRFFRARFPLVPNLLAGVFAAVVPLAAVQAAAGAAPIVAPIVVGIDVVWCALAVSLVALLMRVYDELKDVETDLHLGRAGDPGFTDRPLVTGELHVDDLHLIKNAALVAFVVVVAIIAVRIPPAGVAFAATGGLVWCSSRWFFWPGMKRDLVLAFVTHNPIAGAVGVACVVVALHTVAAPLATIAGGRGVLLAVALVGLSWFPVSAWETARKLRAPADETAYETYSKRLGPRRAGLLVAACFALSGLSAMTAGVLVGASPVYLVLETGSAALGMGAALRYAGNPTTTTARIRPLADLQVVVATAGLALAVIAARGVVVSPFWTS